MVISAVASVEERNGRFRVAFRYSERN